METVGRVIGINVANSNCSLYPPNVGC